MKIENEFQADAVRSWIVKCTQRIIELNRMDKVSGHSMEDYRIIAKRIQESLEASLITYSEELKYGNQTPEEPKAESGQGSIREPAEPTLGDDPEGDYPAGEGTEPIEEAEVDDDLSGSDIQPGREVEEGDSFRNPLQGIFKEGS